MVEVQVQVAVKVQDEVEVNVNGLYAARVTAASTFASISKA